MKQHSPNSVISNEGCAPRRITGFRVGGNEVTLSTKCFSSVPRLWLFLCFAFVFSFGTFAPAQQAGLRAGDEIIAAEGTAFEPIGSFRGKVGKSVVLEVRRGASVVQIPVMPVELEPTRMVLLGWSLVRA